MSRLGYAVANVGERDLVTGYDDFKKRTAAASFPFVSANLVRSDTREPVFTPFTVVTVPASGDRKALRVAVTGVVRFNPVFLKAGPDGTNISIVKADEALARVVPEMRAQADLVVVLAALHKDDARSIAGAVPGIDFVLGAYGGIISAQDEAEKGVPLRYAGNQGKYVGESRVFLGPDGKISTVSNYMHYLLARYPDDPGMAEWLTGTRARIEEQRRASLPK